MARHRACRLLCQLLEGPSWAGTWAVQFWRYWGHVWRQTLGRTSNQLFCSNEWYLPVVIVSQPLCIETDYLHCLHSLVAFANMDLSWLSTEVQTAISVTVAAVIAVVVGYYF